jgi:hypothetical protein
MGATPPIPTGSFDPSNVILTFASTTIIGFAKGTMIKVSLDSPQYTDEVGANGDVVRVKNNDERASIEIDLMGSSPSNDFLSARAILDKLSGTGKAPVEITDLNGRSIHKGLDCWVEKMADAEYGTEATGRAWKLRVGRLSHFVGGTV